MVKWENAVWTGGNLDSVEAQTQILRAHDTGKNKANGWSLWGTDGVDYDDFDQGKIGNCYMISGAATVAEKPERIVKVFDNEDLNEEGFYQVNLYKLGSPIKIQVDDRLPMNINSGLLYARSGPDFSLAGPLLEKAFAKFYGNYEVLIGGNAGVAMSCITGSPSYTEYFTGETEDEIW